MITEPCSLSFSNHSTINVHSQVSRELSFSDLFWWGMQGQQMPTPLCSVKELKELPKRVLIPQVDTRQSVLMLRRTKKCELKSNDTRQLSSISMKARFESAVLCLGARVHTPTSSFPSLSSSRQLSANFGIPCQLINSHTLQKQQRRIRGSALNEKTLQQTHGVSHSKRETGNLQWKLLLCNLTKKQNLHLASSE